MNVKIGARIKELRKRDGVTQEQLAVAIGVTNQAISKWESENGYPDIEYIESIADFFNVPIDYLFGRKRSLLLKADKDACLPIIDFMVKCLGVAKSKGVLALHELIKNQENEFITFAMGLIVDGYDPFCIKDILQLLIRTEAQKETHTAKQHLERIIISEGVLSVQAGDEARLMEIKLLCYLGEDYLRDRGHFGTYNTPERLENRLAKLSDKTFLPESVNFIKLIQKISKTDIQNVLREVDCKDFATALLGCDYATIKTLMDCVSARLALVILYEIDNLQKQESEILEAQEKITAIINNQ